MVSQKVILFLLNFLVHHSLSLPPLSLLERQTSKLQFTRRYLSNSTCQCGARETAEPLAAKSGNWSRIYGGSDANPGDEKWLAMITTTTDGRLCSGSLINDRMVLTAGHCVTEGTTSNKVLSPTDFRIWLNRKSGSLEEPTPETELHFVTKVIPHPEFQRATLRFDAAILILENNVNFEASSSRPICIPENFDEYDHFDGAEGIAFGYGRIDDGSQLEVPSRLQQGRVKFLSLSECVRKLNKLFKALGADFEVSVENVDTHICSSQPSQATLTFVSEGDSGGPVALPVHPHKLIQVGVVSGGYTQLIPQAQMNDPSITYEDAVELYANIFRILPFIDAVAKDLSANWCPHSFN